MYSRDKNNRKSPYKNRIVKLAFEAGLLRLGRPLWSHWLTVLNYHRVDDVNQPGFDSFKPNVSVNPSDFDRQMDYLSKWFNVISVHDLTEWLSGQRKLPPHPAIITFDDGYVDNYTNAYPILRKHGLPAIIFLATEHIGTDKPFYWDLASYCFYHTSKDLVLFPNGQERGWNSLGGRDTVCTDWIKSMKLLSENEKRSWTNRLPDFLNVSIPDGCFRRLVMDWELVREMSRGGIEFGGHTLDHPILTRIPIEEAKSQIVDSKARIEMEIAKPALGFAYPNGMVDDFNAPIEHLVREAQYKVAFSLVDGPASLAEVKRNPFAIRRIYVSPNRSIHQFGTHLTPLNRRVLA